MTRRRRRRTAEADALDGGLLRAAGARCSTRVVPAGRETSRDADRRRSSELVPDEPAAAIRCRRSVAEAEAPPSRFLTAAGACRSRCASWPGKSAAAPGRFEALIDKGLGLRKVGRGRRRRPRSTSRRPRPPSIEPTAASPLTPDQQASGTSSIRSPRRAAFTPSCCTASPAAARRRSISAPSRKSSARARKRSSSCPKSA